MNVLNIILLRDRPSVSPELADSPPRLFDSSTQKFTIGAKIAKIN